MALQARGALAAYTNQRENYNYDRERDHYSTARVKNNIGATVDWKSIVGAMPLAEGSYIATKNRFFRNDYMRMVESMVRGSDRDEKIQAALALGNIRIDFPEFADRKNFPKQSGWADEMLLILGTDRDSDVRKLSMFMFSIKTSSTMTSMKSIAELLKAVPSSQKI